MKTENKIILISITLGILAWTIDSLLDSLFFYKGSLLVEVPTHELYMRTLIVVCLIGFGIICSRLVGQQKKSEQTLASLLSFEQQLLDSIPVPIFIKNKEYVSELSHKDVKKFI